MAISFLYALSYFARCMTYAAIALVLIALFGGGAVMIITAGDETLTEED